MFTLNFGPQHPAAHGVLRLVANLEGEVLRGCDPHIGLLHRGTEKLVEYKNIFQALPYFDRLDYVSMMAQEHVFSAAVENLLGLVPTVKAIYIRLIFLELTRILNHLLAITTHALDVGAMTPFLWAFEEREKIMEFYERASGARMHSNFIRPGGIMCEIYSDLIGDINYFCVNFTKRLNDIVNILDGSRIWKYRLINIGLINFADVVERGFSGVLARSAGFCWDLRKVRNYDMYDLVDFPLAVGEVGDCFDRYLIRIHEMYVSTFIIQSVLSHLYENTGGLSGDILSDAVDDEILDKKIIMSTRGALKTSMESLIMHFKLFSEGVLIDNAATYFSAETPKGELGVFLEFESDAQPSRCKIRSPGYYHLQGLDFMARNHLIADLVTIIGTQDIVFGEIDR